MTSLVLDASVAASWVLPDEVSAQGALLMGKAASGGAIAPFHYPAEIANVVLTAHRRGRVADDELSTVRAILDSVNIEIDEAGRPHLWTDAYRLAQTHRLSLYDALYLELSVRLSLPLATFDQSLRIAAEREGVVLAIG